MNTFAILVLVLQLASGQSSVGPLVRLQAKIPVDPVTELTPVKIAGQYTNPGKELIRRIGGALSGDVLYVFPDNTYVYCEWADIMPTTVFDKGTWDISDGILKLTSGPEITWNPEVERDSWLCTVDPKPRRFSWWEEIKGFLISRSKLETTRS